MTENKVEVLGGQIWKQSRFPYMTCYITLLGRDLENNRSQMAMLSDPRQQGSCVSTTLLKAAPPKRLPPPRDVKWQWDPEDLLSHLLKLDYVCQGQLCGLIEAKLDLVYELGAAKAKSESE